MPVPPERPALEIAGAVAAANAGERLLFLVQTRPETRPNWLGLAHARVRHLEPFSQSDCVALLSTLLRSRSGADAAVDERLARHRRQQYHGRRAALLEQQLDPARDAGAIALLAHHFSQSDRDHRAARYALLAAEDAAAGFANQGALYWYDEAAAALERAAHRRLADLVTGGGDGERPERAQGPTSTASVDELSVRVLQGRAAVEAVLGQYAAAREHLESALARCEPARSSAAPGETDSCSDGSRAGETSALPKRDAAGDRQRTEAFAPSAASVESGPLARAVPELCRRLARVGDAQGDYPTALAWVDRGLLQAGATWQSESIVLPDRQSDLDLSTTARLCLVAGLVHLRRGQYDDARRWA